MKQIKDMIANTLYLHGKSIRVEEITKAIFSEVDFTITKEEGLEVMVIIKNEKLGITQLIIRKFEEFLQK
jgi:hypothetical protein